MIGWPARQPGLVAGKTRGHESGNEYAIGPQNAGDGVHGALKIVDIHQRHLAGCTIEELTIPPKLIFVLEMAAEEMKQRRRRGRIPGAVASRQPGDLCEIRVHGPAAPSLPPFAGPPIAYVPGPHLLELVVGDEHRSQKVSNLLAIVW